MLQEDAQNRKSVHWAASKASKASNEVMRPTNPSGGIPVYHFAGDELDGAKKVCVCVHVRVHGCVHVHVFACA